MPDAIRFALYVAEALVIAQLALPGWESVEF